MARLNPDYRRSTASGPDALAAVRPRKLDWKDRELLHTRFLRRASSVARFENYFRQSPKESSHEDPHHRPDAHRDRSLGSGLSINCECTTRMVRQWRMVQQHVPSTFGQLVAISAPKCSAGWQRLCNTADRRIRRRHAQLITKARAASSSRTRRAPSISNEHLLTLVLLTLGPALRGALPIATGCHPGRSHPQQEGNVGCGISAAAALASPQLPNPQPGPHRVGTKSEWTVRRDLKKE
jgi:hypothetical protein